MVRMKARRFGAAGVTGVERAQCGIRLDHRTDGHRRRDRLIGRAKATRVRHADDSTPGDHSVAVETGIGRLLERVRPEHVAEVVHGTTLVGNALIERKAFSWTKVFEELERVMPPRIHVVSIHPEMNADSQLEIKLVVAGDSRDRALDLVRRMESSQHFQRTEIDDVQQQQGGQTGDSVKFDIRALYVPETPSRSAP